ncbi:hypothetical protein IV500_14945 [Paeniglutamicibacter antarcticus]|uniref:Uncharacterized protein n=1 Tax=Arthrobacter terrae TaxID=2935737 RepID=A0A931CQS0_9MICC|nr:hypothetical protein [Arthrobacter terrae]MBG0740675.1 hypothetical protein [Arthrobacter terrae]
MAEHPQANAFHHAAELMRNERYWHRNGDEDAEFLRALMDVLKEVSYHLDAIQVLDPAGLSAYGAAAGITIFPGVGKVDAKLILMTAADNVLERLIATGTTARNTGVSKGAPG